ncbi:MAG: cupin domain-containing protein [Candidatus Lokiarchaeota archaeon]|nr:cupin domain-containing protein [Candidatus Lokiarchaeota archaeon]
MKIKSIEENLSYKDGTKRIVGIYDTTLLSKEKIMPHFHDDEEEIYYILEGEGLMVIGDEHEFVKAGEIVYIPSRKIHSISATSYELRFITVTVDISEGERRRRKNVDNLGYFL